MCAHTRDVTVGGDDLNDSAEHHLQPLGEHHRFGPRSTLAPTCEQSKSAAPCDDGEASRTCSAHLFVLIVCCLCRVCRVAAQATEICPTETWRDNTPRVWNCDGVQQPSVLAQKSDQAYHSEIRDASRPHSARRSCPARRCQNDPIDPRVTTSPGSRKRSRMCPPSQSYQKTVA